MLRRSLRLSSQRARGLSLPFEVYDIVVKNLDDIIDRVRLAATCRTLREASVGWFQGYICTFDTDNFDVEPEEAVWWRRVQMPVKVVLGADVHPLEDLSGAGVHIVQLDAPFVWGQLPGELAGLSYLTRLSLDGSRVEGGWQHLPPQLRELELLCCELGQPHEDQEVPQELAGLTQLTRLSLGSLQEGGRIVGGWQHLPRQLQHLRLADCGLEVVPAQLAGLTQLSKLEINEADGGWQHLPRQLRELDLSYCGFEQIPAELAGLAQLQQLCIGGTDRIEGGWQHVPRQLQQLDLHNCGLEMVPAELAGLAQLTKLTLHQRGIGSGWQHLPRQLQVLDLSHCGFELVPAALAGLTQLTQLSLANNPIEGGWEHLPRQLQQLDLTGCGLQMVPAELEGLHMQVVHNAETDFD